MNKCLISILIFFVFTQCTPEDKIIPEDILPVDKMKLIVWDMIQAGAYASNPKQRDSVLKDTSTVYFAEVLKLHNINKSDFFKSFNFYQQHPLLNKILFDSVSAYAQRQRNELYKRYR